MPDHTHSTPTLHEDSYAALLTFLQSAVLTVMPDHPHSTSTAVLTVITGHPHCTLTGNGDCYTGLSTLPSRRPCCPLCRIILTSLQPAVLIVMTDLPTPLQLTVLTVMPTHPYSLPTCHADRYAGPSSLHSNRLCRPLCRIFLSPLQMATLTVITVDLHSHPTSHADRYAGSSSFHFNGRSHRYNGSSSLHSNRQW